ncbi:CGNR zinc finger domain-containing protein [Leucobacter zeae]|nr:CGNR zinc finger domain-containing protein [Leucobacter zeae]
MHLNPYGEYAVLLAASLANEPARNRTEIFARTREFGMTMDFPELPDDAERVGEVVDAWLEVVDADDPSERARILNSQMAAVAAYPRMTDHDGEGWHLHYRDDIRSMPGVISAVVCVGTALHLTARGMHRLHRCAAGEYPGDPCTAVVVDVTRNGRQRYCSVRCANRAAVRRHRERAGGRATVAATAPHGADR